MNSPPTPENTGQLPTDAGRSDIRWRCDGDTSSWTWREGPPQSAPKRRVLTPEVGDLVRPRAWATMKLRLSASHLSALLPSFALLGLFLNLPRAQCFKRQRNGGLILRLTPPDQAGNT
jgi:hypothetical protein